MNRAPVSARISVDGSSHPPGDAGHGFEALESRSDGGVHYVLKHGPCLNVDLGSVELGSICGITQDDSGEAFVSGNDVGASADQRPSICKGSAAQLLNRGDQRLFGECVDDGEGRPAECESGVAGYREVFGTT